MAIKMRCGNKSHRHAVYLSVRNMNEASVAKTQSVSQHKEKNTGVCCEQSLDSLFISLNSGSVILGPANEVHPPIEYNFLTASTKSVELSFYVLLVGTYFQCLGIILIRLGIERSAWK